MTTKIVFTTVIAFNYQAFLSGFWPDYFPIQRLTLTSSCRRPAISLTILTRGARGVEERGGGLSCWVEGVMTTAAFVTFLPHADHLSRPLSCATWWCKRASPPLPSSQSDQAPIHEMLVAMTSRISRWWAWWPRQTHGDQVQVDCSQPPDVIAQHCQSWEDGDEIM